MLSLFLILVLVSILLLLGVTIINHVFAFLFLFIEYHSASLNAPDLYPPVPIYRYVLNFFREFAFLCGKYYLLPLKYRDMSLNFTPGKKYNTVILLVHGYSRNQSDWWTFSKKLAADKAKIPIFTVNLSPSLGSIQEIAIASLAPRIADIKQGTQCQEIILICHSMGGLVASYYAEHLDKQNLIKNIFSIGTPYSGTKLAFVASGANAKQMCPGSQFGEDIRKQIYASKVTYYQVATRLDNIVFPWQSQLLEHSNKDKQLILPLESHLGMLHSKKVLKQIGDWINSAQHQQEEPGTKTA